MNRPLLAAVTPIRRLAPEGVELNRLVKESPEFPLLRAVDLGQERGCVTVASAGQPFEACSAIGDDTDIRLFGRAITGAALEASGSLSLR